jgi:hypothetical protein
MQQYDVKSYHAQASGTATTESVRLKNVTVTSGTVSARNMAVADPAVSKSGTWSRTGTTVTVTINGNDLVSGINHNKIISILLDETRGGLNFTVRVKTLQMFLASVLVNTRGG